MDHQKIQEMLLTLDSPGLSPGEQREVMAHVQVCDECRGLLTRLESIQGVFAPVSMVTAPQGIVDRVLERLAHLEVPAAKPLLSFRPLVEWLYPALGYVFALLLMVTAIAHWEPYLKTNPSTEEVLLSSIPQEEQLFFAKEPPSIHHYLMVTQ